MQINDVTDYALAGAVAIITTDAPPVNALSAAVRQGIAHAVEQAMADPAVKAAVLICAGRTFFAGADITEFGKPMAEPTLRNLQIIVENAAKPVIAAMHGTALGGGLELALVAHYRIAAASAKCGLPEVNLGILPGAGGTQRLPRLTGPEIALELITSGRHIPAAEAHALGIIDELVADGTLRAAAIAFAERIIAKGGLPAKLQDRNEKLLPARAHPEIFDRFRKANARRFRGLLAPEAIIRSVEDAVNLPFEQGLAAERRRLDELLAGSQSRALRHVFFAERQAAKIPGIPAATAASPITAVGVIGAGTMGGGIAMNFLNAGIPVTIVETTPEALENCIGVIRKNYENSAQKGKLKPQDVSQRMGLLTPSLHIADLAGADLIIEAVFEQFDVKRDIFAKLDAIAKPGAILASNTSYLDLDAIAAITSRPEHVVGMHFFSPANVMRLLEIVRGAKSDPQIVATIMKLAGKIGKVGVAVGNCFGFVGNRMLAQRQGQAEKLILEGAMPWDVDHALHDFGFPMGPFQMRDLAGNDVGWDRAKTSSATVREILNEAGRFGQKVKSGYYDYDAERRPSPSPIVETIILDFAQRKGINRRVITAKEILQRCLYPMVNEGAKILAEGIASRASDIDIVWVTGYGWPAYRGGPMFWAGLEGLDNIIAGLKSLQAVHGDEFAPAPLLERLASEGKTFETDDQELAVPR